MISSFKIPFYLLFLLSLPFSSFAQSSNEAVRTELERALTTYINKINPPKGCECNDCAHTYTQGYKITKHQDVGGVLRVYGLAKVKYRNAYTGGAGTIEFYAEFENRNGTVVMTRFRWRKDRCMKYQTLFEE